MLSLAEAHCFAGASGAMRRVVGADRALGGPNLPPAHEVALTLYPPGHAMGHVMGHVMGLVTRVGCRSARSLPLGSRGGAPGSRPAAGPPGSGLGLG